MCRFIRGSSKQIPARNGNFVPAYAIFLACALVPAVASAQNAAPSSAPGTATTLPACGEEALTRANPSARALEVESGPEPGATDPMAVPAGRYQLFPDDGLLAYQPGYSISAVHYTTDTDTSLRLDRSQTLKTLPWDPYGSGPPPISATAGRILHANKDSVVTAIRAGSPNDRDSTVSVDFLEEGHSTTLPGHLLPRQQDSTDFLAVAHGDLDHVAGADGQLHDEVVVARVTGEGTTDRHYFGYNLSVLNYGNGHAASPEISEVSFAEVAPRFNIGGTGTSGLLPSDNILSVAIGDFEGDGHKEIALAALGDQTLLLYTYRYETVGGTHTLREVRSQYFVLQGGEISGHWGGQPLVGTLSAVAGDFNGDGADEVAVAYAKWGPAEGNARFGGYGVGVLLLKYGAGFAATLKSKDLIFSVGGLSHMATPTYYVDTRPRVELTAGQFLFNPPSIHYGRKQLVLAWHDTGTPPGQSNPSPTETDLRALSASNDLMTLSNVGESGTFRVRHNFGIHQFSIAAGGFEGASGSLPVASLGVSYWAGRYYSGGETYFRIQTLRVTATGISTANERQYYSSQPVDLRGRFPLVAFDRPGNSRYLGAPVHMTMLNAPSTDYIMQEPPKHVYWNERKREIDNLTRFDRNNVHLYNGTVASMTTESKDQSARNTGGSLSVSAGLTIKAGANFGIIKGSAETSADVQVRAGYDYKENVEELNSAYGERKVESTGQTDRDDYLKGRLQSTDIWRYRIFGTPTGGPENAFYEIMFPGHEIPFAAGGQNFYWYQPVHENGNILSYPARLGPFANPHIPGDVGSYKLQNGIVKSNSPQVPPQLNYFDGTNSTSTLRFAEEVGEGSSFTYSHEIRESLDVKVAYTASATTPLAETSLRVCGSIEAHNSNSWGGAKTTTETTRDETAVILSRAPGSVASAYPFYPVVYNTLDGTMKMSFAVPNPADPLLNRSGYQTYADLYGGRPDPALNLPARIVPESVGSGELERWGPNLRIGRKLMRGLFFREPEINPAAKTFLLLGFNPQDGQKVRIEPRIYNYSTAQPAIGTVVEFQVIPYDSSLNSEVCSNPINSAAGVIAGLVCPRSERKPIGRTTIPRLNPLQFTCVSGYDDPLSTGCANPAFLDWDTTGFGPTFGTNEYRVYVVLNPDGSSPAENYPIEPNPLRITHISNTTPLVVTAPGNTFRTGDYAVIGGVMGLDGANGTYRITHVSNDEFSLDDTKSTNGIYRLSGTVALLDPGQNNEGYGVLGVTRKTSVTSQGSRSPVPHDYLERDAFEALTETAQPRLVNSEVTATESLPLDLRFTVHSTMIHREGAHMLLFDGEPVSGVPAVADQLIHPGAHGKQGSSIWFNWTPSTPGVHHLYAVLLEGTGTRQISAELNVNVIARP